MSDAPTPYRLDPDEAWFTFAADGLPDGEPLALFDCHGQVWVIATVDAGLIEFGHVPELEGPCQVKVFAKTV